MELQKACEAFEASGLNLPLKKRFTWPVSPFVFLFSAGTAMAWALVFASLLLSSADGAGRHQSFMLVLSIGIVPVVVTAILVWAFAPARAKTVTME